jgi:glycosyltransferase involved in cell wall biosynthesis
VLLQNYPRLRFVLFDAGSGDESASVLAKYRRWISYVRSQPDRGQADALNLAFSLAPHTGWLGWLNSDDLFLPGALHAVARTACAAGADFVYGDGLQLHEQPGLLRHDPAGYAHPAFRRYPGAIFSHAAFWPAQYRLPFRVELHGALDYEFWIRLLPRTRRRRHIARPLGVVRIHSAAKSHDPALQARWNEDAAINGAAHPQLYSPDPIRSRMHRIITRAVRTLRGRQSLVAATDVCRLARWPQPAST